MPPKDGDKKKPLPLRVSPDVQARLERLQELRGATSLSEAATDAMLAGLENIEELAYSSENKRLVNQRLRAKQSGAIEAVQKLKDIAQELDLGNEVSPSEVRAIAESFKAWLRE
jgi:uncharacterized protein YfkK (UPF0435 family)